LSGALHSAVNFLPVQESPATKHRILFRYLVSLLAALAVLNSGSPIFAADQRFTPPTSPLRKDFACIKNFGMLLYLVAATQP
jgi:hypothetical protein